MSVASVATSNHALMLLAGRVDLILVVDNSGSIAFQQGVNDVKNFTRQIIQSLDVSAGNARVGFILFADDAQVRIRLGQYVNRRDLLAADELDYNPSNGKTNTPAALDRAREELLRNPTGRRRVVVLLTDGATTFGSLNQDFTALAAASASRLRNETRAEIFVVGVTSRVSGAEQNLIATSNRHIFNVTNFNDLSNSGLINGITSGACVGVTNAPPTLPPTQPATPRKCIVVGVVAAHESVVCTYQPRLKCK